MEKELLKKSFIYLDKEYVEGEVFIFLKQINIKKEVKSATMISSSFGMYEVLINNNKIDDQLFKPGFQYYKRRLCYQEYNLKDFLNNGNNELKFYLGQGWYSGRYYCENTNRNFGEFASLSYILEIEYIDGSTEIIKSEENDPVYSSLYLYAGLYDGESIDDNLEIKKIGNAKLKDDVDVELNLNITKVIVQDKMNIYSVKKINDYTIIDFNQNYAGIIYINTKYLKENETITIRHGELLNKDGTLYTSNLRKAKQTITYKKGKLDYVYKPIFTYMGFRYIEIKGVDYKDGLIEAYSIHTKMERTGFFESTNNLINKLYNNVLWSQKSNYIEIPTDCPQRDERLGYTGDGHVFFKSGSYNYNTLDFFKNFFIDLRLGQLDNKDHNVPPYLPQSKPHEVGFMSMQGWGSAVSLIPYYSYNQYGDFSLIEDNYDAIKMYVDLEIKKAGRKYLWNAISLGDWLSLNKGIAYQAMNNHPISNAFFVKDLEILIYFSKLLNKDFEYNYYNDIYKKTKNAYIKKFINKNGVIKKDYQGAYVLALKHVLNSSDSIYEKVKSNFIKNVIRNGLDTGFFGTEYLLPLLCDYGKKEIAYDILLSDSLPSWMYEIKKGATTIWERWDAIKEDDSVNEAKSRSDNMVSFNHYSFGSVVEFYYEYILGIKPLEPGFKKVVIKPYTDRRLNKVSGSYKSVNGLIKVVWEYKDNFINYEIETPVESTIILDKVYNVSKGKYNFRIEDKLNE